MSYEGYEIVLCTKGHLDVYNCYDGPGDRCACGSEWAWMMSVDTTNDSGIEPVLELEEEQQVERCPTCDHVTKVTGEERYKIPSNCGHMLAPDNGIEVPKAAAKFRNNDTDEVFDTLAQAYNSLRYG